MKQGIMGVVVLLVTVVSVGAQPLSLRTDSSQAIADRIIQSDIPVLVDFWASWCMPCRMLDPVIEKLEEQYRGRVLFVKVNVDIHRALTAYFGVKSLPTIFIMNNKSVVGALPGVLPEERYKEALDAVCALPPPNTP